MPLCGSIIALYLENEANVDPLFSVQLITSQILSPLKRLCILFSYMKPTKQRNKEKKTVTQSFFCSVSDNTEKAKGGCSRQISNYTSFRSSFCSYLPFRNNDWSSSEFLLKFFFCSLFFLFFFVPLLLSVSVFSDSPDA